MAYASAKERSFLYKGLDDEGRLHPLGLLRVGCYPWYELVGSELCISGLFQEESDFQATRVPGGSIILEAERHTLIFNFDFPHSSFAS